MLVAVYEEFCKIRVENSARPIEVPIEKIRPGLLFPSIRVWTSERS
jgi:hypothetical protein